MNKPAPYPKLNFPGCHLKITRRGETDHVWDPLRGRWLVLTPEEWVRRHVIAFLSEYAGIPAANISQEHPVAINGMAQRADIVVTGREAKPVMLVECKAPGISVRDSTLEQAFRYNAVLGAHYVMLTNGLDHYIYRVTDGRYESIGDFPDLSI